MGTRPPPNGATRPVDQPVPGRNRRSEKPADRRSTQPAQPPIGAARYRRPQPGLKHPARRSRRQCSLSLPARRALPARKAHSLPAGAPPSCLVTDAPARLRCFGKHAQTYARTHTLCRWRYVQAYVRPTHIPVQPRHLRGSRGEPRPPSRTSPESGHGVRASACRQERRRLGRGDLRMRGRRRSRPGPWTLALRDPVPRGGVAPDVRRASGRIACPAGHGRAPAERSRKRVP